MATTKKRTDKQRIDWLQRTHFDLIYTSTLQKPRWCVGADEAYFEVEGDTVREAIDKGMDLTNDIPSRK